MVRVAVLALCGRMPLAAGRRRTKSEARRGQHPPTHEPQVCRTCRLELAASHFSVASNNLSGRCRRCRACCADAVARRLAAWAPPDMPQTKECLECQQELPAAEFSRLPGCASGLQPYCRACNSEQGLARSKARLRSQLPMPMSIVCAAYHEAKPLSEFAQRQGAAFDVQGVCSKCKSQRQHAAYVQKALNLQKAAASAGSDGMAVPSRQAALRRQATSRRQAAAAVRREHSGGGGAAAAVVRRQQWQWAGGSGRQRGGSSHSEAAGLSQRHSL